MQGLSWKDGWLSAYHTLNLIAFLYSIPSFFWSFASFLCLSLTHTHGPHSTSMEPTFSTPAS